MSNQIVIKLNKKKFEPLLNHLMYINNRRTYSECVGFSLFIINKMLIEKLPNGLTRCELLLQIQNKKLNDSLIQLEREYNQFVTSSDNGLLKI